MPQARDKTHAFHLQQHSTSQMLKPVMVDSRNTTTNPDSSGQKKPQLPFVRLNTMKQKRSNEFDSLAATRQMQLGSRLVINQQSNEERLSETSKSMLFIDGPRQIPSVMFRPPINKRMARRRQSKTPRSLSLEESPSIAEDDKAPVTKRNEIKVEEAAI